MADPAGHGFGVLDRRGDFGGGGVGGIEGGEKVAAFPNVGTGAVGSDQAGIAPGVDGEEPVRHGGGKVHGSAVDADNECRLAQKPEKFGEAGPIEEVGDVGREVGKGLLAASDEHNRMPGGAAEGADKIRCERFAAAAGERVEDDEGSGGNFFRGTITPGQGECGRPGQCGTGRGGEGKIAFDGVCPRIDGNGACLCEARALAGVGESVDRHAAEGAGDECGAE